MFKHSKDREKPEENVISPEIPKETEGATREITKDSKYSMKKILEPFRHDEKKDSPSDQPLKDTKTDVAKLPKEIKSDAAKPPKDSKSGIKKFFDSFKHESDSVPKVQDPTVQPSGDSAIVSSPKTEPIAPKSISKKKEPESMKADVVKKHEPAKLPEMKVEKEVLNQDTKAKPKDTGIKKLFHFKTDSPATTSSEKAEKPHVTFAQRDSLKRSHSFKDSILLKDEEMIGGSEKVHKDGFQNVKNYLSHFKHDDHAGTDKTEGKKSANVKRSQSCKETNAEKEGFHGMRNFIDSITHKSILKSSHKATSKPHEEEHIYDAVGKPEQMSSTDTNVMSDKAPDAKHKDEHSGMRKLFDTFRHRDSSPKQKPKDIDKNDKIYEKVDISSAIPSTSKPSQSVVESRPDKPVTSKSDVSPKSQIPQIILNVPESRSDEMIEAENKNAPSSTPEPKTSVLSSISDNFMAFKDKIIHSKDSKKTDVTLNRGDHDEIFQEYDLQIAANSSNAVDSSVGTYKPVSDDMSIAQNSQKEKSGVTDVGSKPSINKAPLSGREPVSDDPKTKSKAGFNFQMPCKTEPGTPETLYDTCCIRLANLLGKKALEIVSEKTKTPPKKPPKPSAEAIAKARAAVVSQRLRNIHNKGQSIGESIPIGYDGIRFADDETESSCDYKDVDNFDYIMDYELINRYKCDSKLDCFSDPSICSGISSYYTADTVTLKDENFSDNHMENVSLGSNDSFHMPSAPCKPEFYSLPTRGKDKREKTKSFSANEVKSKVPLKQSSKSFSYVSQTTKRVPPPLPPKPNIIPKRKESKKPSKPAPPNASDPSVSQCINGLSLSPRLQTKFSKDAAATRQRPLMVAGFKGTEFTSLQTKHQGKGSKERTFSTVLKNESLRNVSTISPLHKPLQSSKSSPDHVVQFQVHSEISTLKKQSPQRPPLPANSAYASEPKLLKTKIVAPPVPEKPKRESRPAVPPAPAVPQNEERRTVSPPRPPPPVLNKVVSPPPPRPPPPIPNYRSLERSSKDKSLEIESTVQKEPEALVSVSEKTKSEDQEAIRVSTPTESPSHIPSYQNVDQNFEKSREAPLENYEDQRLIENTKPVQMDVVEKTHAAGPQLEEQIIDSVKPKPPPRGRRIRSRTVEMPPKEPTEQSLRRSQSLSDIDVHKKISQLTVEVPGEKSDLKHLYTSVNKNGKKLPSGSQSPNVSSRPLPAPPPPPRKFRSLDRKPKNREKKIESNVSISPEPSFIAESVFENLSVRPPERKKKADKYRFQSLSAERKKPDPELSEMSRSSSMPLRPGRRAKQALPEYDENANVAFSTVAEVHPSPILLDECGNEIHEPSSSNIPASDETDSAKPALPAKISPRPRQRKDKKKSHSSWYDETQTSEDWEVVDWEYNTDVEKQVKSLHGTAVGPPLRRKSDPMPPRRTSKFYVDVEVGDSSLMLSDKETSPLHIDQSEKSVQTSLETLSQGIVSRDEESELAESSDTDNLLSMVKTLQSELKSTLNRHKSFNDDETDELNVPGDSEKAEDSKRQFLKSPSAQSSTSELWVVTSSEESEAEISNDGSSTNLSDTAIIRKKNKIFYIAQEMMTSEEVFVDTLKLLNVDFKAFIEETTQQKNTSLIPDEVLSQILNHLPQLQHLNENLLMELKDRIENWDKTEKIADVIVKVGPFLKLYSWYIHDFESNVALLEDSKRKFPLFAQAVKEFEASPRCKRLALNHYMLKPIQRIPQYRLLLQEYLHQLSENSSDYQDTVAALQIVSEVANHANDSMKQGDNAQKLISIQNSIMGHKEIIKPGRLFVKEGELMKLSRKGMQPRWFVLFNDLLLYLSPVQQGLYRINHELHLTGMKVAIPIQQDYQNEFSIISVTRSFTLAARSPEERQEWIVALTKAIEENASKRSTFNKIRLLQNAQETNSEDDEEFVLGKRAPVWIPDARVTMCQLCTSEFTVTFRRHHCRACGKVVCSICSSNRIPLAYLGGTKVYRVCDDCFSKLGSGYAEGGETDSDNQQIAVKSHLRSETRGVKKGKRNLPSVLKEVCANDQGSTISGYLQKRTGKSWKKEWFVVKDKVLYEYKASEDVAALKSVPLLGYQIEPYSEPYENVDSSLLFQLTHPGQAPIIFHTDSVGSTERWIAALKDASVLE